MTTSPLEVIVKLRVTPFNDEGEPLIDEEHLLRDLRENIEAMELLVERVPLGHDEAAFNVEVVEGPTVLNAEEGGDGQKLYGS